MNLFALDKIARKHVLIAGGIGITPFLAQLEDLHQGRVPYELHYCVRSPEHAAFLPRLREREGERVHVYYDSEGQAIDFERLLSDQPLGTHVYVCGPAGMIDRVMATARSWGWPDSHIHWEQFSAPPVGDAFDVFLARSKMHVHVPPDQSLMESIEAAGVEVPYLCRGGVCGFCQTRVLELDGELVHNDHYLSERTRQGQVHHAVRVAGAMQEPGARSLVRSRRELEDETMSAVFKPDETFRGRLHLPQQPAGDSSLSAALR